MQVRYSKLQIFLNIPHHYHRFDSAPSSTNSVRGQRTIRICTTGAQKKGFTVALCATADGSKLPALVTFKEKNGELGPMSGQP